MVQCFNGDDRRAYVHRLEKVKFGVPLHEAFSHDIPATLLVLLLKINKQGPYKKDIWRAPGNQAHVRKLISVMQHGRLVNIDHFSVYTAASVVKKFLCKIPYGIFGLENEEKLFDLLTFDEEKQRSEFCRIVSSLPVVSQHLLVLLIGTFWCIVEAAEQYGTRMNPDAIGLSVAPSLFHSCIHDGERAKMEDLLRFRSASKVISLLVRHFGCTNLFPRENYEFYARITGRTLRLDEHWHFTFQYPSASAVSANANKRSFERFAALRRQAALGGGNGDAHHVDSATFFPDSAPLSSCRPGACRGSSAPAATMSSRQRRFQLWAVCFASSFPAYGCGAGGVGGASHAPHRWTAADQSPTSPKYSTMMNNHQSATFGGGPGASSNMSRSRSSPARVTSLDDLLQLNRVLMEATEPPRPPAPPLINVVSTTGGCRRPRPSATTMTTSMVCGDTGCCCPYAGADQSDYGGGDSYHNPYSTIGPPARQCVGMVPAAFDETDDVDIDAAQDFAASKACSCEF